MAQVSVGAAAAWELPKPERRRSEREELVVRVSYATVDELFSDFTRDINEGGLFIATDQPEPPGTVVAMRFALPGSDRAVETSGRVVRVSDGAGREPAGMGIEFDPLSDDASTGIDELIRSMRAGLTGGPGVGA